MHSKEREETRATFKHAEKDIALSMVNRRNRSKNKCAVTGITASVHFATTVTSKYALCRPRLRPFHAVFSGAVSGFQIWVHQLLNIKGSDYFTENFQLRENKTRMRNIHPRFFHLLFYGLRLGFRLGFGLGLDLGIVLD